MDPKSAQPVTVLELLDAIDAAPPLLKQGAADSNLSRDDIRVARNRANVRAWLYQTPGGHRWKDADGQRACLTALQTYGLTPFDLFQIANVAPTSLVESTLR